MGQTPTFLLSLLLGPALVLVQDRRVHCFVRIRGDDLSLRFRPLLSLSRVSALNLPASEKRCVKCFDVKSCVSGKHQGLLEGGEAHKV